MKLQIDGPLVDANWLNDHKDHEDLVILDASPSSNVSNLTPQYPGRIIHGAKFFDLKNDFTDTTAPYPNTIPTAEEFTNSARRLGINDTSTIVVYDNIGIYSAPRAWWLFRAFGHQNIAVLNGGIAAWVETGYKTTSKHSIPNLNGTFKAILKKEKVKFIENVAQNIKNKSWQFVDARSNGRFAGVAPEPRPSLSSGHVPNSLNLPFTKLLHEGYYKTPEELKAIFDSVGLDERPIMFSCGSGLTACILDLAAEIVLNNKTAVYDGSWTEWASKYDGTDKIIP